MRCGFGPIGAVSNEACQSPARCRFHRFCVRTLFLMNCARDSVYQFCPRCPRARTLPLIFRLWLWILATRRTCAPKTYTRGSNLITQIQTTIEEPSHDLAVPRVTESSFSEDACRAFQFCILGATARSPFKIGVNDEFPHGFARVAPGYIGKNLMKIINI